MNLQTKPTVVQLPRPLKENHQTWSSPVYGLNGSKKRKRLEVAIAVDGEAVNIYDIQSPRLITSHPVPPQSCFTCAPCSIRTTKDGSSLVTRRTYCAIQRPSSQLQYYTERNEKNSAATCSKTVLDLGDTDSPVVMLQIIPSATPQQNEEPLADVIAVHQNGIIRRISSDLKSQRWRVQASHNSEDPSSSYTVVAAHWLDIEDAKKGVLRRREDVLTTLAGLEPSFLLLVTEKDPKSGVPGNVTTFGVWSLSNFGHHTGRGLGLDTKISPVTLKELPQSNLWNQNPTLQFDFSTNGTLSIGFRKGLITYDLASYSPEILSQIVLDEHDFSSLMRLSPSLVVGASATNIALYDTKYQSIQATITLENVLSSREKKMPGRPATSTLRFISYFPKIHTIIAIKGHRMITFEMTSSAQSGPHKASEGLLTNSIGRGIHLDHDKRVQMAENSDPGFGTLEWPVTSNHKRWVDQEKTLDAFFEARNVESFEELMAAELYDPRHAKAVTTSLGLKLPSTSEDIDRHKVRYLLSKIFQPAPILEQQQKKPSGPTEVELNVVFMPPRLFAWLIEGGFFVPAEVEMALSRPFTSLALRHGAITQALVANDPSFDMLTEYLLKSSHMPMSELVECVKVLLDDALGSDRHDSSSQTLRGASGDMDVESGARPGLSQVEGTTGTELVSATQYPTTYNPLPRSQRILLLALEKFGSYSSSTITSGIRSRLENPQVLALVQYLRQQLFRGGFTTSFHSPAVANSTASQDGFPMLGSYVVEDMTLSLDAIIKVLSSCIDAIGPFSSLASGADEDFIETLIPDLKTEISLALAGIEEATYLRGILREVMRYGESLSPQGRSSGFHSSSARSSGKRQKPGTIATLVSEPTDEQGDPEAMSSLLPLALRAEKVVTDTKVRKGGGQVGERSKREKMHLKGRNVGRYSFERLVL